MVRIAAVVAAALACAGTFVAAHPGQDDDSAHRIAARSEYLATQSDSVAACTNSPEFLELKARAIQRRSEWLSTLRRRAFRRAARRDLASSLAKSHKSNLTGLTAATDPATLFGTEVKCILQPESTEGPYYVSGELIRNSIAEGQAGLPLYVDMQFIDSKTCKPVPSLYVDFWHANTTGVYAGVIANGNGNSADKSLIYKTNHRGVFPTDNSGVVNFTTTFPGRYSGRTTHIHIATSSGGTVLSNGTYANPVFSHVGQLFFDQSLIDMVNQLAPYSATTAQVTLNSKDGLLGSAAATTFDPMLNYAFVNDDINQGILAWISVAVDTSAKVSIKVAVNYAGNSTTASSSGSNTGGGPGAGGFPGASPSASSKPSDAAAHASLFVGFVAAALATFALAQ